MRRFTVLAPVVAVVVLIAGACTPKSPPTTTPAGSTTTITVDGEVVTVTGPAGSTVSVDSANPATMPLIASSYSLGALDIDVSNIAAGSVARVSIKLQTPVNAVRKLIDGNWDRFVHDGTTGATISADGLTVTLDLMDGGRGDTDNTQNGVIIDPVLIGHDAGVIPAMIDGEPFSHQLEATNGTGPITWSVISGTLPDGITLDPSGLLSGTPGAEPNFGLVRVEATDGVTSATKLLMLAVVQASTAMDSTGAPLPEAGTSISLGVPSAAPGGSPWMGQYSSDGTLSRFDAFSAATLAAFMNASSTMILGVSSNGPGVALDMIDTDTGAVISTLATPLTLSPDGVYISPNSDYVAVGDTDSQMTWIFDTDTGAVERTIPSLISFTYVPGGSPWRPDSTEIMSAPPGDASVISVFSATNPAADRTVTIAGQNCSQVTDWSATNRFALACADPGIYTSGLVTASAVDGSDVRVVAPGTCDYISLPCSSAQYAHFSPTGNSLVMTSVTMSSFSQAGIATTLAFGSDTPHTTLTPITTELGDGQLVFPLSWTTLLH